MKLKGIELKDGMIIRTKYEKYVYFSNRFLCEYKNVYNIRYASLYDIGELTKITYGDKVLYKKKEILDEKEKEYLSAVIKPFRNRVKCITKYSCNKNEYIHIVLNNKGIEMLNNEGIELPFFEKGTMYKGMEVGKEYTLEELGL